jgi:lipase chaperone LimK
MLTPVESLADRRHAQRIAEITARQRYWESKFSATAPGDNQRNFFAHEIMLCEKKIEKLEIKHKKELQEKTWHSFGTPKLSNGCGSPSHRLQSRKPPPTKQ